MFGATWTLIELLSSPLSCLHCFAVRPVFSLCCASSLSCVHLLSVVCIVSQLCASSLSFVHRLSAVCIVSQLCASSRNGASTGAGCQRLVKKRWCCSQNTSSGPVSPDNLPLCHLVHLPLKHEHPAARTVTKQQTSATNHPPQTLSE